MEIYKGDSDIVSSVHDYLLAIRKALMHGQMYRREYITIINIKREETINSYVADEIDDKEYLELLKIYDYFDNFADDY